MLLGVSPTRDVLVPLVPTRTLLPQIWDDVFRTHFSIPALPGTHWFTTFSHLNSYAAGYYSYLYVAAAVRCQRRRPALPSRVGSMCVNAALDRAVSARRVAKTSASSIWYSCFHDDPFNARQAQQLKSEVRALPDAQ